MGERERFLLALIYLLQQEVRALRSVLSEYDDRKHDVYVQWTQAETLRQAIETMEHKL